MRRLALLGAPLLLACAGGAPATPATRTAGIDAAWAGRGPTAPEPDGIAPAIAPPAQRDPIVGIWTTDSDGRRVLNPATEIPNIDSLQAGWVLWTGESDGPVAWTETITAPRAMEWDGLGGAELSDGGRTATIARTAVPEHGFVSTVWRLGPADPPGTYRVSVALPEGRVSSFSFVLGDPLGVCPYSRAHVSWWWLEDTDAGDPWGLDLTSEFLWEFAARLERHGFVVDDAASIENAYWIVRAIVVRYLDSPDLAHGWIQMRAMAEFNGRALRYDFTTTGRDLIDNGMLFSLEVPERGAFARKLADEFAAKLAPHMRRMCDDWARGSPEEEARLERIRDELASEIERVRAERSEREQRKRLSVGVGPPEMR